MNDQTSPAELRSSDLVLPSEIAPLDGGQPLGENDLLILTELSRRPGAIFVCDLQQSSQLGPEQLDETLERLRAMLGRQALHIARYDGYRVRPPALDPSAGGTRLRAGDRVELDLSLRIARIDDRWLRLNELEMALLALFMRRPGELIGRFELLACFATPPKTPFALDKPLSRLRARVGEEFIRCAPSSEYALLLNAPPLPRSTPLVTAGEGLVLDPDSNVAQVGGRWVPLTPPQGRLLATLIVHGDRFVTLPDLYDANGGPVASREALVLNMKLLRRAIGSDVIEKHIGPACRLMRSAAPSTARRLLWSGSLKLDTQRQKLNRGRQRARLTKPESDLAACLFEAAGALAPHARLMDRAGFAPHEATAYHVAMNGLREQLRKFDAAELLVHLETGYRLAAMPDYWRIAGLELDITKRVARLHGLELLLSDAAFAVAERLSYLPGAGVTPEALRDYLWFVNVEYGELEDVFAELQSAWPDSEPRLFVIDERGHYRFAIERFGLLAAGHLLFDPAARCAHSHGREAQLDLSGSRMLGLLMRRPGSVQTRTSLAEAAKLSAGRAFVDCLARLRAALFTVTDRSDGAIGEVGRAERSLYTVTDRFDGAMVAVERSDHAGYRLVVERLGVTDRSSRVRDPD